MAPTFRYRYVDIGTVFTGDSRKRDAHNGVGSPSTLFANELACDVGGTCWGPNEPLAILDHHLAGRAQSPSACAAVLHKSRLIRDRFAQLDDVIWLVTHKDPDFDALCSMYLARWLIESGSSGIDWERYGLHPDGWLDLPTMPSVEWLNPDFSGISAEDRWPLLLTGYASMVETRQRIPCSRRRELRSILFAALKRGRSYLNETSGATEFFDEIRGVLQEKQLNPAFDSVLEGNLQFAPELAMLDREAAAYEHDLKRARKALVYLPEAEAPSPNFFEHPKIQPATTPELGAEPLLLADSFRIASDGIYLRDPECVLFREWARVDVENSALGGGFDFTAIAFSHRRPEGAHNHSEYVFSIDPGRANGRHLYTVWSRLQTEEVEALRRERTALEPASRRLETAPATCTETLEALLSDPWLGGQNRSSTLVETPRRGTLLGPPGIRGDLRDDPVVEAVRTELEAPIYSSSSQVEGPQIAVYDFAAFEDMREVKSSRFGLNSPLTIPPPESNHFRFASIGLRPDVPLVEDGKVSHRLARQIGEALWHALHPERKGEIPQDFEGHLCSSSDAVGIWSERGVAVAQKAVAGATHGNDANTGALQDFTRLMSLLRDIDRLAREWDSVHLPINDARKIESGRKTPNSAAQAVLVKGEDLARRALDVQHALALPKQDLLRHFCEAIAFDGLVARLRDLNQAGAEHLRREATAEETRRLEKRADETARLQQKLKWLEIFVIGFVAIEIIGIVTDNVNLNLGTRETLVWLGGPLTLGGAVWLLQPWRIRRRAAKDPKLQWVVIPAVLVWLAAWISQILRTR